MKHMKFCSTFSVIGFVLSLFFGIFSKSGFFKVVLIALVWAIAFFALGMLISFVFDKFLAVETSEYDSNMPQSAGGVKESVGKNVDIVIQDQELDRSESSNKYNIGDTIKVEICKNCHPLYTGKRKLVDSTGRVDKFKKRFNLE